MEKIFLILAGASAVGAGLFVWRRNSATYESELRPVIEEAGFKLIQSQHPGMGNLGPFPALEIQLGVKQGWIGGVSGQYSQYRVVEVTNSTGEQFTLWACLEFEAFQLQRIRWRPDPTQRDLPDSLGGLVEEIGT